MTAADVIARLDLQPHPEGGYFRETHRSSQSVVRLQDQATRSGITCIDFLLPAGSASRWHRVLSDEIWHFTDGEPLDLALLDPTSGAFRVVTLGRPSAGRPHAATVPAGWWQAARPTGAWSLCTCSVGPGFDFADFSFLEAGIPVPAGIPNNWMDLI